MVREKQTPNSDLDQILILFINLLEFLVKFTKLMDVQSTTQSINQSLIS